MILEDESSAPRGEDWNDAAVTEAVDFEVGIDGPNFGVAGGFGHADEAGIGEVHGGVVIFLQQFWDVPEMIVEIDGEGEAAS